MEKASEEVLRANQGKKFLLLPLQMKANTPKGPSEEILCTRNVA